MESNVFERCFLLLLVLLWLCLSSGPVRAQEDKVYNNPRFFDHRLDVCTTWGTDCGQPVADTFCKRKRYTAARSFVADPNIGDREPTMTIGSKEICDKNFCAGFKSITCRDKIPGDRVFVNPAWNDYRLDACIRWGHECGKPAADAYCRHHGFERSFFELLDPERGYAATRLIGTDEVCDQNFCVGFQMIICE